MPAASTNGTNLYQDVVNVARYYFGPVSERFISRQIRQHLKKEPDQLQKKDLAKLINWIKLAMSLLVEDEEVVKRFVGELKQL